MEVLVSPVDLTVSTTLGHSVRFQANVARPVPPAVVAAALQAGARPSSEKDSGGKASAADRASPEEVAQFLRSVIDGDNPDLLTQAGKVRGSAIDAEFGNRAPSSVRHKAYQLIDSGEV